MTYFFPRTETLVPKFRDKIETLVSKFRNKVVHKGYTETRIRVYGFQS